jgi:CheY-like chemotaxis protein
MNNQSWNKVLIVDDEPTIRWVLAEALRGWDYDTVEAETGAATRRLLLQSDPLRCC